MLHRIQDPSIGYIRPHLTADRLDRCLEYLVKYKYHVLSFYELINAAIKKKKLYKTVCFTVDDGYIDFKNIAYPLFKKHNFPATVFITTDFVEGKLMLWRDQIEFILEQTTKPSLVLDCENNHFSFPLHNKEERKRAALILIGYFKSLPFDQVNSSIMRLSRILDVDLPNTPPLQYSALSWEDIREMEKDKIDFQPHTVTHPILSKIKYSEQAWQIKKSKEAILDNIRSKPVIYCYPNGMTGDFTEETISLLKKEGFLASCVAELGFFNPELSDFFRIPRIPFPRNYIDFVYHVSGCKILQLAIT